MLKKRKKQENNWAAKYIKEYNQMVSYYEKKLVEKDEYIEKLEKEIECFREKKQFNLKQKQIRDKDIDRIKELRAKGLSYSKISDKTGWSKATISRVLNDKI